MLGSGVGAANCADFLNTSKLALFDSKLARSRAKLDRRDRLLLSDARLSLLLRFKEDANGEEPPVT